jgi:hypothetical protein
VVQSDDATEPYGDREHIGAEQSFVGALPHLNISTPAPESKNIDRGLVGVAAKWLAGWWAGGLRARMERK